MSRVGKMLLSVPLGTEVFINNSQVTVKGLLGELSFVMNPLVSVLQREGFLSFRPIDSSVEADALSGTMRALVANMVVGVTKGFEKKLSLVGVGYRASIVSGNLNLQIGFSHPTIMEMPEGIKFECPTPTEIIVKGSDLQAVGQKAAEIRSCRPPEPYKGKGIRYFGEKIVLKETKKK
jgi:large subunit ribosomal protein L6